eukprot:c8129_g1_i4.p1 GENE.c8129_g1_i4~~c8129_g1_i4.p1  ORF type:complete len:120 (+),score=51.33 c8129_g1_i4:167-526(+)
MDGLPQVSLDASDHNDRTRVETVTITSATKHFSDLKDVVRVGLKMGDLESSVQLGEIEIDSRIISGIQEDDVLEEERKRNEKLQPIVEVAAESGEGGEAVVAESGDQAENPETSQQTTE